jgi:hypothetical protein
MARKRFAVQPSPFWYDPLTGIQYEKKENDRCEYWASHSEYSFYFLAKAKIRDSRIYKQYPVIFKPATDAYDALLWKVDFSIFFPNGESRLIEVKGDWILHDRYALQEFQHKLQFLELYNRKAWESLIIVGSDSLKIDKKVPTMSAEECVANLVVLSRS